MLSLIKDTDARQVVGGLAVAEDSTPSKGGTKSAPTHGSAGFDTSDAPTGFDASNFDASDTKQQ